MSFSLQLPFRFVPYLSKSKCPSLKCPSNRKVWHSGASQHHKLATRGMVFRWNLLRSLLGWMFLGGLYVQVGFFRWNSLWNFCEWYFLVGQFWRECFCGIFLLCDSFLVLEILFLAACLMVGLFSFLIIMQLSKKVFLKLLGKLKLLTYCKRQYGRQSVLCKCKIKKSIKKKK